MKNQDNMAEFYKYLIESIPVELHKHFVNDCLKYYKPHDYSKGAPKYVDNDPISPVLREIACKYSNDPGMEWADKYGTYVDNDLFTMHQYCWCGKTECEWCKGDYYEPYDYWDKGYNFVAQQNIPNKPHFHYKPYDFKVWWYKYIGRNMKVNKMLADKQIEEMLRQCMEHK